MSKAMEAQAVDSKKKQLLKQVSKIAKEEETVT